MTCNNPITLRPRRMPSLLFPILILILTITTMIPCFVQSYSSSSSLSSNNDNYYKRATKLFSNGEYKVAADYYWSSIISYKSDNNYYTIQDAFQKFLQCYVSLNKANDAFEFVVIEAMSLGQFDMASTYVNELLKREPTHEYGLIWKDWLLAGGGDKKVRTKLGALSMLKSQGKNPGEYRRSIIRDDNNDSIINDDGNNNGSNSISGNPTPKQLEEANELYNQALPYFNNKQFGLASQKFQQSCDLSGGINEFGMACINAIYCRCNILDWGGNSNRNSSNNNNNNEDNDSGYDKFGRGGSFDKDMQSIIDITKREIELYRRPNLGKQQHKDNNDDLDDDTFHWIRPTSAHPHMMLGFPFDDISDSHNIKKLVAESHAYCDEPTLRYDSNAKSVRPLPDDLPFDHINSKNNNRLEMFRKEFGYYSSVVDKDTHEKCKNRTTTNAKIRLAFVSAAFSSKAVLYLSHDLFPYFNQDKFEIHIFSLNDPDNPNFIKNAMNGVDWRQRVKTNVTKFHDVRPYKNDHIKLARYVYEQNIHVLIDWDGYARQGSRPQGLMSLRPSPVQILHQEYLGTMGSATNVDYVVTDVVTTPPLSHSRSLFAEKLMYMPNHFFSKGHAVQNELIPPKGVEYEPRSEIRLHQRRYEYGKGSPQDNHCTMHGSSTLLSWPNLNDEHNDNNNDDDDINNISFVYCNFNKFLKANPQTVVSWLNILERVPTSILCLLENPSEGIPNLRTFVDDHLRRHRGAGTDHDTGTGSGGDNRNNRDNDNDESDNNNNDNNDDEYIKNLLNRIRFLPWEGSPFIHQGRNRDFCNVILDSHPYNGHTTGKISM